MDYITCIEIALGIQAKKEFSKGEKEKAIDLLTLLIERHSDSSNEFNPLVTAAKTRLCRIYMSQKDYQKVIWAKLDLYYHHRMQMLFMQL